MPASRGAPGCGAGVPSGPGQADDSGAPGCCGPHHPVLFPGAPRATSRSGPRGFWTLPWGGGTPAPGHKLPLGGLMQVPGGEPTWPGRSGLCSGGWAGARQRSCWGCGLGRVTAPQVHGVATSRVSDRPRREEGTLGPRTPATAPRSCSPGSNQLWVGGRRASARARCCPRARNEPLHRCRPWSRPQSRCPRFPGLQEGGRGAGGRARRPTVLFLSF